MSEAATPFGPSGLTQAQKARLRKRHRSDRLFRLAGLSAVVFSALVLAILLFSMAANGIGGFQRSEARFAVDLTTGALDIDTATLQDSRDPVLALEGAGLPKLVNAEAERGLGSGGSALLSPNAWEEVADEIADDPSLLDGAVDVSIPVDDSVAAAMRGEGDAELRARASQLMAEGKLVRAFDFGFLARADDPRPQQVGVWGALKGSILTMLVTIALAFPIGVLAALYLEEFAPKNRWVDLVEVSINNLAAVPSIIFGLLGLSVFLWIFPNWRSAPVIGGMTLALMTMPVIVITGRNAIKAVPPSIRDAALGLGASRVQVVFHHVLPLALPGILTGTIIGMARALGETAPLLMIGMRAFVASPPDGFTSPSSVLPVQIFLWSTEIDRGFVERTSAAIIVLLLFLLVMNGIAVYLRNKFEVRW
jgi:phosphate transport system permease protein